MTITLRRRGPAASPATSQGPMGQVLGALRTSARGHGPGQARWTAGHDLATKACSAALICAVAAGPVALICQLRAAPVRVQAAAAPVQGIDTASVVAGEAAVSWVTTWLTTDRAHPERLRSWYAGPEPSLPATPARVDRPVVASVERVSGNTWSVVVAVDVAEASPAASPRPAEGSSTTAGGPAPSASSPTAAVAARRYYQTAMIVADVPQPGGRGYVAPTVQALTLPAPVAGPVTRVSARPDYGDEVAPSSYLGATVTTFLQALLAGQGDVTRLTSPETAIVPVTPPVASQVRLITLALGDSTQAGAADAPSHDGDTVRALAEAALTLPSGELRSSQYPLTLTGRAGRWEVSSIDLAPTIRTSGSTGSSSATPTPSPSS